MLVQVNVGGSAILLFKATEEADDKNAVELTFQDRYGEILAHQWFGDGYIVLGFASGYVRSPCCPASLVSVPLPCMRQTRSGACRCEVGPLGGVDHAMRTTRV
jgi:hypothetical protein